MLEERERDERVKIEWLRSATKEGFDAFEHGDFSALDPGAELESFMKSIHREIVSEVARDGSGM